MDFDEVLAGELEPKQTLKVDRILRSLPEDQAEKVERALRNRDVSSRALARALAKLTGKTIGRDTVTTWRTRNAPEAVGS